MSLAFFLTSLFQRYFLSGNFDRKIRLWNIPEHRVVEWVYFCAKLVLVFFFRLFDLGPSKQPRHGRWIFARRTRYSFEDVSGVVDIAAWITYLQLSPLGFTVASAFCIKAIICGAIFILLFTAVKLTCLWLADTRPNLTVRMPKENTKTGERFKQYGCGNYAL